MNQNRLFFVMKAFALLIVFFACFLANAQTSVQFIFANGQYSLSQYTNVQVILQPEQLNASGSVTILQPKIYQYTDTNASTTFSNLAGNYSGGYYHWTVPAFTSADGFNPPIKSEGDIQIVSTNLGLISSTSVGVTFTPVYNGFGAAWTAQASDLRYSQSSNNLTSYVQIGQLNSTSNSIAAMIPSTNGFIGTNQLSNYATTNYANGLTNNFTPIVYSNSSAFTTPSQVTNLINALATTNGISATTATNIANWVYSNNPSGYLTPAATNPLASTNFVNASIVSATNALASTNYVAAAVAAATNQLANTNALSSYTLLTVFTAGTNSVATNSQSQLNSASNVLASLIVANTNGLAFAQGASNYLQSTKQPASLTLSNLSASGAYTNSLLSGIGSYLTTNNSGTIVSINVSNQTFLTNGYGSIVTHNATDYILTNALPALTNGLVTAAVTNGLATIAYANSLIGTGIGFTNGLTAGQNLSFTTNLSGTIITINATNQTFLTNGITGTAFQPLGFYLGTNSLPALTNGFVTGAITNGLATQSYVTSTIALYGFQTNIPVAGQNVTLTTNMSGTVTYYNATNQTFLTNGLASQSFVQSQIAASNSTFATVSFTTNLVIASTNGGNLVFTNNPIFSFAITNGSQYQTITNGFAQGFFGLGTKTNFLITSNVVEIIGGNYGDGTYIGTSPNWTNAFNLTNTILFSGGNYYIQNNGVSLYQSTNIVTWALVSGSAPAPVGAWGSRWNMNGVQLSGFVYSTNLNWQITNAIATLAGNSTNSGTTNFTLSGYVTGFTTNNSFSSAGSNSIINLIAQYGVNPTNGISAATATNIAAAQVFQATNGFTSIVFSNPSAFYLNSNPSNFTTFQVVTNLIQQATNGITGGSGTNAAQIFFTPTNPYSITASAAAVAFNTNGCIWINRDGVSNNWLNIITNN